MRPETKLCHAGLRTDKRTGAVSTPIYQTATFCHERAGHSTGYDYSRSGNPTREVLEKTLADMEGAERGFAFASGMAAVTAALSLFSYGETIIVSDDLYGGTYRVFETVFSRFGIKAVYADTTDPESVEKLITPGVKGIFIETPSNPMMKVSDLHRISALTGEKDILLIVDNTFMTPYLQQPIKHGADIVIHSGSKYLGGHNDVISGFLVTASPHLSNRIAHIQNSTGGVLAPFDSWLMLRGIKTLHLRLERAQENARLIADWMLTRNDIIEVYYPGIESGQGYDIQSRQASGFGAMISFRVKNRDRAETLINNVRLISFAESLGGVESLITYPMEQTHGDIPREMKEKIGVTENLLRLSVGIEHYSDLIEDLKQALEADA